MRHCEEPAVHPRALVIAGPTATGKSALALRCAERFGGVVVNADAMQVYRDLRILTARPSEADEKRAPHALFGTVDGGTAFSVEQWLQTVEKALTEAWRIGRLPVIVGGTGLYLKALTQGLASVPAIPPALRDEIRQWARSRSAGEIHRELAGRDPVMAARLRPTDTQRLTRALEVVRATGRSLSHWQTTHQPPLLPLRDCIAFSVSSPRAETNDAVDQRFSFMVKSGALEEAETLRARKLDPGLPIMRSLGLRPLFAFLSDQCTLEAACAAASAETRRYVKRQETFFRTQLGAFRSGTVASIEMEVSRVLPTPLRV